MGDGAANGRGGMRPPAPRDPRDYPKDDDLLGLKDGRTVLVTDVSRDHVRVAEGGTGGGTARRKGLSLSGFRTLVKNALIVRRGTRE